MKNYIQDLIDKRDIKLNENTTTLQGRQLVMHQNIYLKHDQTCSQPTQSQSTHVDPLDANKAQKSHQLVPTTFVWFGLLADEQIEISNNSQLFNDGFTSCFRSNTYPITNQMCRVMNYQGKGLGLHEQGILEPIHVYANQVKPKALDTNILISRIRMLMILPRVLGYLLPTLK